MKLHALVLALALSGCATKPEIQYVSAPIPKVVVPPTPVWATDDVTDDMPIGEVAKRWKAYRIQSLGYIQQLQELLKPYE